jgi:hypothetical protein
MLTPSSGPAAFKGDRPGHTPKAPVVGHGKARVRYSASGRQKLPSKQRNTPQGGALKRRSR